MFATTPLTRSLPKGVIPNPDHVAKHGTSNNGSNVLQMDKLHATVIQVDGLMPHLEALAVDQNRNEDIGSLEKAANMGPGQARGKASAQSSERISSEASHDDSKSSKSTPGTSRRSSDSDSSTSSAAAAWACKPSDRTLRLQATCERLLAQHQKDTQFGSAWQTWWNVVSAQPIYDMAFMLPIGLGKITGHPELILLAGFLIEFVAKPLAIHTRSGSAGSVAFDQYNLMVKLLGERVRDIAGGKVHPLDAEGNSTDPYDKFSKEQLLKNWRIKMAHDDALLLCFDVAYSTKNVIPTALHDYSFYSHKTLLGTAADVGLHASSGMAWATIMTLLNQTFRYWAYPGKYQRTQSLAVLDADIARLDSRATDLKREMRQLKPSAHALDSTASGTDTESEIVEVDPQAQAHEAARLLLRETRKARKQARQARSDATFGSKVAKDYRAIWCGEKRKPAIAGAVGLSIMFVPLVVTSLHEIQKLALGSSNGTQPASFEDHLESDLLVPGVMGVALVLGGTMGSLLYILMEGVLGCTDRCSSNPNDAVTEAADENDTGGDMVGAAVPDDDSVVTVHSSDSDSDNNSDWEYDSASNSDLEYESASEA